MTFFECGRILSLELFHQDIRDKLCLCCKVNVHTSTVQDRTRRRQNLEKNVKKPASQPSSGVVPGFSVPAEALNLASFV